MAKPSAAKKLNSKPNSSSLPSPTKASSGVGVKRPAGGDGELKKKPDKYVEESEVESGEEQEEANGGSGSEDGSESEPEESNVPDSSQPTKKPPCTPALAAEKSETPKPPKASSSAGVKQSAGWDGDLNEQKRLRKKPGKYFEVSEKKGTENDESRMLFQRLWSEDDEIAILNGMIDFSAKKKVEPFANLDAFLNFIQKSVHVNASKSQLQDKIRKMRTKYKKKVEKEKKGKLSIFPKEHDQKVFELSKKVWGSENTSSEGKAESPKFSGEVVRRRRSRSRSRSKEGKNLGAGDNGFVGMKFVNFGLGNLGIEEWIMENIQFVGAEERAKMSEKWKNFKMVEAEFNVKKLELKLELTNLVLDALKSSGSTS